MRKSLALVVLLAAGALSACDEPPPYYGPPGPGAHIRWCLAHHPGYNPNTNLFPDAYGRPRACVGPRWAPAPPPPPPAPPPPPP